jgi:hypothetical protein
MLSYRLVDIESTYREEGAMLLAQLIDTEELEGLSPEALRQMILKLDDEVTYGSSDVVL